MPRVETYGQRKVRQAALPGARRQAAETVESQGGQIAAATAKLGEAVTYAGATILREEQEKADQLAFLNADRQGADLEHQLLHAKDKGALNVRGVEAQGLHGQVLGAFDEQAGMIVANLQNDRQRIAVQRALNQRRAGIRETVDRHAQAELTKYDANETDAYVQTALSAGVQNASDMRRVALELGRGEAAIKDFAKRNGIGAEATGARVAAFRSDLHVGVLERMLATEKDQAAQIYFEETKTEIAGDKLAAVEKALEAGSVRGSAQRATAEILAAGGTFEEQRARAKEITNAKVQDDVLGRIEHEHTIRAQADRAAHEQLSVNGKNIIDRTGDWRKIPPADWARLTVGEASALKNYAEDRARGVTPKTDPHAYYLFSKMATSSDPKVRKQFLEVNLTRYVDKLAPSDWQQFVDLQGKVRQGDEEAAHKLLANTTNQNAMVDEALVGMGLDPSPLQPGSKGYDRTQSERVAAYRRAVREAVTRFEVGNKGQSATDADVQRIVDQLRTRTTREVPGRVWGTNTVEGFAFETAQAQAASVADVPAAERRQIERALRRRGKPVTDAAILALFNLDLSITRGDR